MLQDIVEIFAKEAESGRMKDRLMSLESDLDSFGSMSMIFKLPIVILCATMFLLNALCNWNLANNIFVR